MNNRLVSLDVMRGLTVAMMILVNNGVGHNQFHTLQHSQWNGLTVCDLVFPFFLFMVGVSVWLSHKRLTPEKIVRRTVKLFLVGLLLHVWDMLLDGQWTFWTDLRIWGVLQRIALCYCATAFLVYYSIRIKIRWRQTCLLLSIIGVLLLIYSFILDVGDGFSQNASNWIGKTDRWLFGEAHLYRKSPIDPEGLLSTLPAIAHTILGALIGRAVSAIDARRSIGPIKYIQAPQNIRAMWRIMVGGVSMLFLGLLYTLVYPLNKRIWSPSYVFVTCGLATLLLLLLIYAEWKKPAIVDRHLAIFNYYGLNAFFLYVLSEMLSPVMSHLGVNYKIYEAMLSGGIDPRMASLGYALLLDGVIALVAWAMWKRKIFVKI